MIDKDLLPWLRLAHGLYNLTVIVLFFFQGVMGLSIRRARLAGRPLPVAAARRHRRLGPLLILLGLFGFCAGLIIVTLGDRNYLENWHHLFTGSTIALLLVYTYRLTRRIKGPRAAERNLHFHLGITILLLYVLEAFLGIGILL